MVIDVSEGGAGVISLRARSGLGMLQYEAYFENNLRSIRETIADRTRAAETPQEDPLEITIRPMS
jgi:hypothetical protein